MWPPAPLVVQEYGDGAGEAVLDEVGESWFEVIPVGELKCVPPAAYKYCTSKRRVEDHTSAQQHQR